jgi:nucleotide-binding universal stress UspA family protein
MYRHLLVPVDGTPDTRLAAPPLAAFLSTMVPCQVTLVAVTSPALTNEQCLDKARHARQALYSISDLFTQIGVFTRHRLVENIAEGDMATALAKILSSTQIPYDLILLGTHYTCQEEFDLPCGGSLADRICGKVNIPVMVLPTRQASSVRLAPGMVAAKDIAMPSAALH